MVLTMFLAIASYSSFEIPWLVISLNSFSRDVEILSNLEKPASKFWKFLLSTKLSKLLQLMRVKFAPLPPRLDI